MTSSLRLILLAVAAIAGSAFAFDRPAAAVPAAGLSFAGSPEAGAGRLTWSEQIVTAANGEPISTFGYSVALSADTALIGTQGNGAYVFERSDGLWEQRQKLAAAGNPSGFGHKVAIHGDTAVVSATPNLIGDIPVNNSVHVFERSNGTWSEVAVLASHAAPSTDRYGSAVAVSGDTILVGAYKATLDDYAPMQGAAYLYRRVDGVWTLAKVLHADDGRANEYFGLSVALSGGTALVGARDATIDRYTPRQGAAYVFDEAGGAWTQAQKLYASDGGSNDFFGSSVALDGDTALVGAPNAYGNGEYQGAAYLFRRSGGAWTQFQKLRGTNGRSIDQFGISVALSGSTALVGAYLAEVDGRSQQGAVHAFAASERGWVQADRLVASDGAAGNQYGWSVALDGTTALTGAHLANVAGHSLHGKGYFLAFTRSPMLSLAPGELRFELEADASTSGVLGVANAGDERLDYAIAESRAQGRVRFPSPFAVTPHAAAPVGSGGAIGPRRATTAPAADDLEFALDDGSYEDTITLNQGNGEAAAVWLNRFTVPQGTGAFTLGTMSIQWPHSANGSLVGKQVNLVAYYDADGDGDPVDAIRLGGDHFVTIEELDRYLDYVVNIPVPGEGDLYIGFENSYARGGWTPKLYPAALDTDSPSVGRSWLLGRFDGDADIDSPGANHYLGQVETFGFSGNWLIRGRGINASNDCVEATEVPWLVLGGAAGSVEPGDRADVAIGVDATGLVPGRYDAQLCVTSNDPGRPLVRVPIRLDVNPPGLIFRDGFETP